MDLPPLYTGTLLRRYKRFLADIRLEDGREITAHCPNTGSMRAVNVPGCRVWVSHHLNPRRKLAWSWELIELPGGDLVSIHTGRANAVVEEAIGAGALMPVAGIAMLEREVRTAEARLDFRLTPQHGAPLWIEVKQVTLREADGEGYFPDSVSERGRRHLERLAALAASGDRAMLVFLIAHTGIDRVHPAVHLDPRYARAFECACRAGVEVVSLKCRITPQAIVARAPAVDAASGSAVARAVPGPGRMLR